MSEALEYASSRFSDGETNGFETVSLYRDRDLATILEIEHWRAKIGESEEISPFDFRVTTTWRLEDDTWKIVLRHADPIRSFDPSGPLRST